MRILLFNSPPRSGKDTAAKILGQFGYVSVALAAPLKRMVLGMYDIKGYCPDDFESVKDIPQEILQGKSFRDLYKAHGQHMKRVHGDNFWVDKAISFIKQHNLRYPCANYAVTDVGFPCELKRFTEEFDDVSLVKIHRDHCNYASDSRYDLPEVVTTYHVDNNGTIQDLEQRLKALFCKEKYAINAR